MKKVISVALSIIIIISMSTFTLASDASNSITLSQNTVSMLTSQSAYSQKLFKYAEDVINMIEGTQDIKLQRLTLFIALTMMNSLPFCVNLISEDTQL